MADGLKLNIPTPCSADQSNFKPTANGGFCNHCAKEVIDFTNMTDQEILAFFKNNQAGTCGKFKPAQLKQYPLTTSAPTHQRWLGARLLGLLIASIFPASGSFAQSVPQQTERLQTQNEVIKWNITPSKTDTNARTIRGIVRNESGEIIPFVSIVVRTDPPQFFAGDADGKFSFNLPQTDSVMVQFQYIGYTPLKMTFKEDSPDYIKIQLNEVEMDLLGKVMVDEVYSSRPSFWRKLKRRMK
jgi:hypothetical protein